MNENNDMVMITENLISALKEKELKETKTKLIYIAGRCYNTPKLDEEVEKDRKQKPKRYESYSHKH